MNKRNFLAGILIGAAAGVLISKFLSSDKGKKVVTDLKDEANKMANQLKNKINQVKEENPLV